MTSATVHRMDDYRADRHQVENGHVRLANGVYDDLLAAPLTCRQLKVALAVIRKTYGFGKKTDRLAISQIAEMTGIRKNHVSDTLRELLAMKVLYREGGQRGPIGYNKRSETWELDAKPKKTSYPKTGLLESELPQNGVTELPQNGNHKRQTDKSTTSEANASDASAASAKPKKPKAPECPFEALADLYRDTFPDKPQPQTLGDRRKRIIRQGWQYAMRLKHRKTGLPLYTDTESGLDWWRRFMAYVRDHAEFCMAKQHNFSIDWLFTAKAIEGLIDGKYNGARHDD